MDCYAPSVEASRCRKCDAQNELGITSCVTCHVPRAAQKAGVGRVGIQSMYVHRAE